MAVDFKLDGNALVIKEGTKERSYGNALGYSAWFDNGAFNFNMVSPDRNIRIENAIASSNLTIYSSVPSSEAAALTSIRGLFSRVGGGTQNAETTSAASKIANAAGVPAIDSRKQALLDELITGCKADGTWDDITYLHAPALSPNLAGALVTIKNGAAPVNVTNTNFVAADFIEDVGFSIASNANKQIQTGFIPDNNGMSNTNICFGIIVLDNQNPTANNNGGAGLFGDNPATGEVIIGGSNAGSLGMGVGLFSSTTAWGQRSSIANFNGANYQAFNNGVRSRTLPNYTVSSPAIGATNTPITMFKYRRNGADYFGYGSYGAVLFSKGTTQAKAAALAKRWHNFRMGLQRIADEKILLIDGDSIAYGQGNPSMTDRYGFRIATRLKLKEVNIAMPSARMTTSVDVAVSGLDKQNEINYKNVLYHGIAYGTNDSTNDTATSSGTVATPAQITTFRASLATKILAAKAAGVIPVVFSMPWNSGPSAKNISYLQAAAAEAKAAQVPFVNLYRTIGNKATPTNYFVDGVHFNALGTLEAYKTAIYVLEEKKLVVEGTLTPGLIAAGATYTVDVTVENADFGMNAFCVPMYAVDPGLTISAFVKSADTITIKIVNTTASGITPTAGAYYSYGAVLNY